MYLKNDCTGPASKIQYGKKGERVTVLKYNDNMALVELNKIKFWVRVEDLIEDKNNIDTSIKTTEVTKNIVPKKTIKAVKKENKFNNQIEIFI